jgi:methionyl-tRNA synthetase
MNKNNNELLNNLGNFINRSLAFCEKNLASELREMRLEQQDYIFMAKVNKELKEYDDNLNKIK